MIDCCVISLVLCGVILAMLAMFFNYNLKLDARTFQLEKKNGAEQKQIDELKNKLQSLESLLGKSLTNVPNAPLAPIPPTPPFTPKPQPKVPQNPSNFVQELKDKQSQGKLKPSEFK